MHKREIDEEKRTLLTVLHTAGFATTANLAIRDAKKVSEQLLKNFLIVYTEEGERR